MKAFDLAASTAWAIQPETLQLILEIATREHEFDVEAVAAKVGRSLEYSRLMTARDGVAIIPIEGPIFPRASMFTRISGATSIDALATDLNGALEDPAIGAILLDIDSPGGEANGVNEFADMVYAARARKPITAYVSYLGASAAYWIASAAGEVVVDDTALIGSIGVVSAVPDPSKRTARDIEFVSSQSPKKRADPTTEGGRSQAQARVDALADVFVAKVARNRNVTVEKVLADFGEGDIRVGAAAVAAGMVDRVGSFESALAALVERYRAPAPPPKPALAGERGFIMGWKDRILALVANAPEELDAQAEEVRLAPALVSARQPAPEPAKPAEPDPRVTQLEAEVARLNAARISAEATGFADTEIAAARAYPAEREALVALYTQAAIDDTSHGVQAGGEPRVARLRAAYASRPPHKLTRELIPTGEGTAALLNQQQTDAGADTPPTAERRDYLLGLSALGQDVLRARNGHKN